MQINRSQSSDGLPQDTILGSLFMSWCLSCFQVISDSDIDFQWTAMLVNASKLHRQAPVVMDIIEAYLGGSIYILNIMSPMSPNNEFQWTVMLPNRSQFSLQDPVVMTFPRLDTVCYIYVLINWMTHISQVTSNGHIEFQWMVKLNNGLQLSLQPPVVIGFSTIFAFIVPSNFFLLSYFNIIQVDLSWMDF